MLDACYFILSSPGLPVKMATLWGWGFSSLVEPLPSERKALGSVPSSEKKKKKMATLLDATEILLRMGLLLFTE